jgi:hypothetical protein
MSVQSLAPRNAYQIRTAALTCLLSLTLAGCLGDGKSGGTKEPLGAAPPPSTGPSAPNSAPTISGSPLTSAKVNQAYSFQPTASDADGDPLTFVIANKPAWASFDPATGRLSGTPSSSSTGAFANIRISVTDGKATTALGAFTIDVASLQPGSATLSWQSPTTNTDGSPLTNLAGYVIRYGNSLGQLSTEVRIANPGLTTYVVSELAPSTWYFQVSAYNTSGVESAPSATASKTIT